LKVEEKIWLDFGDGSWLADKKVKDF
jgi:hypothetical protein